MPKKLIKVLGIIMALAVFAGLAFLGLDSMKEVNKEISHVGEWVGVISDKPVFHSSHGSNSASEPGQYTVSPQPTLPPRPTPDQQVDYELIAQDLRLILNKYSDDDLRVLDTCTEGLPTHTLSPSDSPFSFYDLGSEKSEKGFDRREAIARITKRLAPLFVERTTNLRARVALENTLGKNVGELLQEAHKFCNK